MVNNRPRGSGGSRGRDPDRNFQPKGFEQQARGRNFRGTTVNEERRSRSPRRHGAPDLDGLRSLPRAQESEHTHRPPFEPEHPSNRSRSQYHSTQGYRHATRDRSPRVIRSSHYRSPSPNSRSRSPPRGVRQYSPQTDRSITSSHQLHNSNPGLEYGGSIPARDEGPRPIPEETLLPVLPFSALSLPVIHTISGTQTHDFRSRGPYQDIQEPTDGAQFTVSRQHPTTPAPLRQQLSQVHHTSQHTQQQNQILSQLAVAANIDYYGVPETKGPIVGIYAISEQMRSVVKWTHISNIKPGYLLRLLCTSATTDRRAKLGDGKTIASYESLLSSKWRRILVFNVNWTGGVASAFEITSRGNRGIDDIHDARRRGQFRLLVNESSGDSLVPNNTGKKPIHFCSTARWESGSFVDTTANIYFRPHDQIEFMGGVDIDDLHRVVHEATDDVRTNITSEFDRLRSQRRRWPSPPAVGRFSRALQHQTPPAMMVSSAISPTPPPQLATQEPSNSAVVCLSTGYSVLPMAPPARYALPVTGKTFDPARESGNITEAMVASKSPRAVSPHDQISSVGDKQFKSTTDYVESGYQSGAKVSSASLSKPCTN